MTESDGSDGIVVDRLAPADSFERLAHEVRLQTIQVLNEEGPLPHARLREHVGVDDPGRFNYHLQKLDGTFVREVEEGYDLTAAGRRVVGAVLSGGYTSNLSDETIPADAECLRCDGGLTIHVESDGVFLGCVDCDQTLNEVEIPPGVLEGCERTALYPLIDRWVKRMLSAARYGFCHRCDGPIDHRILRTVDEHWDGGVPEWLDGIPVDVVFRYRCHRCGEERYAVVASVALLDPAVVGFHYDHGVDVHETPMTALDWLELGVTTVESTDPLIVSVPVTIDGETLVASFDENFTRVAVRRT